MSKVYVQDEDLQMVTELHEEKEEEVYESKCFWAFTQLSNEIFIIEFFFPVS